MLNEYFDKVMEAARDGNREAFLAKRLVFLKYFGMDNEMPDDLRELYESCLDKALGSVNVLTMREKWLAEAEKIYKEILMQQGQKS